MLTRYVKYGVFVSALVAVGMILFPKLTTTSKMTADEYQSWIVGTYDYRFGRERPFAPSNADTEDGKFIAGQDFIPSSRCAKCHTDAHPQWRESAHANSFREPFYQKNVTDLIRQKNIAFTRHCESCHNPAALFSGALTDKPQFKNRPFDEEGVSCIACHSIRSVDGRGIGGYVMGRPAMLEKSDGTRILEASDQQILDDVPDHRRAMMRDVLKRPEFCGACHKSQVPRELNDYKFLRAFAVADELQQSAFSKESPHPFYVRSKETCNTCHMPDVATKHFDVSAKDGNLKSHRWASANTAIPSFYGYVEQMEEVVKFLQDDKMGIDVFAFTVGNDRRTKQKLFAPANRKSVPVRPGDSITADVVITNKNIGHSFPPELRDFYEAFVEFTVVAESGRVLFKSGYLKPDGSLDDDAHSYKTYLVNGDGSFNDRHHIWKTRVVAQNLSIPSGRSDLARYRFTVPVGASGPIRVTARLQYRRFSRVYSDYALGESRDLPIVMMAKSERVLMIGGETAPDAIDPKAIPDWRRWNNYGIALLDQRQFPQAADAFDEVIDSNVKDYKAFALTNKALALMEMGGWREAEKLISRAIETDAANLRALFQAGRVQRVQSRLEEAEKSFRAVLERYPRDRMTLQQLGELAKIKSDTVGAEKRTEQLEIARTYYQRILDIDPEDAGSHYNMMIISQKLGNREAARFHAAVFKDLKDDPQMTSLAGEFLEKNRHVGNESLPFHVHELALFQPKVERTGYLYFFE